MRQSAASAGPRLPVAARGAHASASRRARSARKRATWSGPRRTHLEVSASTSRSFSRRRSRSMPAMRSRSAADGSWTAAGSGSGRSWRAAASARRRRSTSFRGRRRRSAWRSPTEPYRCQHRRQHPPGSTGDYATSTTVRLSTRRAGPPAASARASRSGPFVPCPSRCAGAGTANAAKRRRELHEVEMAEIRQRRRSDARSAPDAPRRAVMDLLAARLAAGGLGAEPVTVYINTNVVGTHRTPPELAVDAPPQERTHSRESQQRRWEHRPAIRGSHAVSHGRPTSKGSTRSASTWRSPRR